MPLEHSNQVLAAIDILPDFSGLILDDGRLRIDNLLGAGAYGTVYEATSIVDDPESGCIQLAVKCMLTPPNGSFEESLQINELELHQTVSEHANVVTLHRVFHEGPHTFAVLAFCGGGDLITYLEEHDLNEARDDNAVRSIVLQLIDAVEHCHQHGVYHRDLKPENILFSSDGQRVFLADFGLATREAVSLQFGVGTVCFLAPECVAERSIGDTCSPRLNDIWALGILMVNILTGCDAWESATADDEDFKAYIQDPDALSDIVSACLSPECHDILKRVLCVDPEQRITLAELRASVQGITTFFEARAIEGPLEEAADEDGDAQDNGEGILEIEDRPEELQAEEQSTDPPVQQATDSEARHQGEPEEAQSKPSVDDTGELGGDVEVQEQAEEGMEEQSEGRVEEIEDQAEEIEKHVDDDRGDVSEISDRLGEELVVEQLGDHVDGNMEHDAAPSEAQVEVDGHSSVEDRDEASQDTMIVEELGDHVDQNEEHDADEAQVAETGEVRADDLDDASREMVQQSEELGEEHLVDGDEPWEIVGENADEVERFEVEDVWLIHTESLSPPSPVSSLLPDEL